MLLFDEGQSKSSAELFHPDFVLSPLFLSRLPLSLYNYQPLVRTEGEKAKTLDLFQGRAKRGLVVFFFFFSPMLSQ